jgi:hypothetical protein
MTKERKPPTVQAFSGPLWEDRPRNYLESAALEELVRASYENPVEFRADWLNPLLAEGLDIDNIFEVLLAGSTHPN